MKFKFYLRKSSFKKDKKSAQILLNEIKNYKPKNFLEVGVFQGVTSRNVCEKKKKYMIIISNIMVLIYLRTQMKRLI